MSPDWAASMAAFKSVYSLFVLLFIATAVAILVIFNIDGARTLNLCYFAVQRRIVHYRNRRELGIVRQCYQLQLRLP